MHLSNRELAVPEPPHLGRIIAEARKLGPARVAVTYPCSASAIEAVMAAERLELIEPVLVGPRTRIQTIAAQQGLDVAMLQFVDTPDDPCAAALTAVALCRQGGTQFIMKGSLHSDELLSMVVRKDGGLRTRRRTSHAFVFDLPHYPKPLLVADCVVNISPGLTEKQDITQNAIELAHSLGITRPYVSILSAVETVNPAIPSTVEAAALSKMAQRGQITGATVDGPLAFDVAISIEAARIKGIEPFTTERPDILIVPNLEAGNILYKQLVYLAQAECAGIVLGTAVPIILTSRADSERSRVSSCALAVLHVQHKGLPGMLREA
jgi:phosphate acetyltransferase